MSATYSLEKYIPRLGQDVFVHPDHISDLGDSDKFIPGLGYDAYVPGHCIDVRGGAEKYIPGLGVQHFIHPDHTRNYTP